MPTTPDKKVAEAFKKENGMTITQAWKKVQEWHLMGKKDEAISGCKLILKHFPDHQASNILEGYGETAPQKSIAEQAGQKLADAIEHSISTGTSDSHEKTSENPEKTTETVLDEERLFATIGYAWIFCLIPILMKKESEFIMFHARQGLIMAMIITVFDIFVWGVFGSALRFIYFIALVIAAYKAYQGKRWKIPLIHELSTKLPF